MRQHALRTAITLYRDGTLDLNAAAGLAGVSADRLERAVERLGTDDSTVRTTRERVTVNAD